MDWIFQQGPAAGVVVFLIIREINMARSKRNGNDPLNRLTAEVTKLTESVNGHVVHQVERHGKVLQAIERNRSDIIQEIGKRK